MIESENAYSESRQSLLDFIWSKRKIIIIMSSVAAVVSLVISLLLTPIFKSTAIVFPAATSTVSFSEQRNAKASAMDFGEEEQAEQLIQILQSSRIRNKIVDRFKLMEHYGISMDDANKYHKLGKKYEDNILFTRTRYGSICIDVFDRDRVLAAEIANKIVDLIDTVKNEMIRERTIPAFEVNQRKRNMLETEKAEILRKMDSLSKIGVVSIEGRANLYSAYNQSKNVEDRKFFKNQIDVNLIYGAEFDGLENLRDEKLTKLAKFEEAYEQAESDANAEFNHKFVVEPAVVADKKAKPKRLYVILVSTMGVFIFTIFTLLVREKIRELRAKNS